MNAVPDRAPRENPSSSDEGDAKTRSKKTAFSFEENGGFRRALAQEARARPEAHTAARPVRDSGRRTVRAERRVREPGGVRAGASSLGARPSARLQSAAARVARIAVEVSAAAAGAPGGYGTKTSVPACFLDDEHAQTVAALAAEAGGGGADGGLPRHRAEAATHERGSGKKAE